jgi:hypothetical protein
VELPAGWVGWAAIAIARHFLASSASSAAAGSEKAVIAANARTKDRAWKVGQVVMMYLSREGIRNEQQWFQFNETARTSE